MDNLKLLAWINDEEAKKWRQGLETAFMEEYKAEYSAEYEQLNTIRDKDKGNRSKQETEDRYQLKLSMQKKWFKRLQEETTREIRRAIELTGWEKDSQIIVMLPESYWRSINDNKKHPEIFNYGKPFYIEIKNEWQKMKKDVPDSFQQLTDQFPNMIIFAGTLWWKAEEDIFNTMPIFFRSKYRWQWSKNYLSDIDGLGEDGNRKREKFVAGRKPTDSKELRMPSFDFGGETFAVDICFNFISGETSADTKGALSQELCLAAPGIQVLIAGGMPVDDTNEKNIWCEKLFLRCDALSYITDYENGITDKEGQGFACLKKEKLELLDRQKVTELFAAREIEMN